MNQWGVPDWRDRSAYPRHKWPTQWRWEFLRRLHEYRADWEQRDNTLQIAEGEELDRLVADAGYHPPPEGSTSWREALARQGFSQDRRHAEKWGVNSLRDPALNWTPPEFWVRKAESLEFMMPFRDIKNGWSMAKRKWSQYGPQDVFLRFDLSGNIAEQMRAMSGLLKDLQSEYSKAPGNRRHTADELIRYLRVLDAKDAGETNRAIGEIVCKPRTGEAAATEAKRLVRVAKGVQLRMACKSHLSGESKPA